MKALAKGNILKIVKGILKELLRPIPNSAQPYIDRMSLAHPVSISERFMRKMVVFALRNANVLHSEQHPVTMSNRVEAK